jgi:hypothetical protein
VQFNRNELAGAVIAEHLNNARIGVVVRGLTDINVERVATYAADKLNKSLHVAAVDYPLTAKSPKLTLASEIEKAVLWRSMPDLAGHIIVFVQGEKKRLHSLEDLDIVTARHLAHQLLINASKELSSNQPQAKFWEALRNEAATFPLSKIEDFVKAVYADKKDVDSISDNLWRIGLLKDRTILQVNRDPKERLRRNRELIVEMSQLSEQSRRQMSSVLAKAKESKQAGLTSAFKDLMEFFRRGGDSILQRLDVATVEQLLKSGRPLPSSGISSAALEGKDDVDIDENKKPGDISPLPDRPLRGRSLMEAVAQLAVRKDQEAEQGLHELGESYRRTLEDPQHIEEAIITPGFGGQTLHPDPPSRELRFFTGYTCKADSWGGILNTEYHSIREAIRHVNPENEFISYNPNDPSRGILGQCLFSLLRKFDDYLKPEKPFTDALSHLITARSILLRYLDLLLAYPLVLFGGYPEARQALNDYLSAYAKIIHALRQYDATLHSRDANALRYVIVEILRLEVVYIRTPGEWKAILTPLHPFHLWRFREILKAVHSDEHPLTEEAQKQLSKALPELPHLLHFVIFSPDITGEKRVELPQAGSYELLPTYENHTNRYLGNDGLSFLSNLLRRWLDYAPYSRPQIRLALVDVPDLRVALKSLSEFFDIVSDTRLMVDCHFTRGQNPAGELARFDYDDKDHELAKLLESGKLTVQLHNNKSLAEVARTLTAQPVHVAYLFDQSRYHLGYAPRAKQLLVSPLVITYEYEYSEIFKRGSIAPSSEADEGLFSDFHFLVHRAAHLPPGQQIRLQHEGEMDLESVNMLLQSDSVRWLVIADRVLTPYRLENAVPLSEQRIGQREVAIWTKSSARAVARFVDLLRQFNLQPESNVVADLLRRFSHIAAGGLFSVPLAGSSGRESKEKGLLGTVLAAAWYMQQYPGALIASLDSSLAQQWLKSRPHGEERADLIGLRVNGNALVVEPIEVKTRAEGNESRVVRDPTTGRRHLEGRAVEQLRSMLGTLVSIFGGADDQPLFTPARREVLKYQLHRECFREVHDPDWQKEWYRTLQQAFTLPHPLINISLQGLVLHVHLEENSDVKIFEDATQPLALTEIGAKAIQGLVGQKIEQRTVTPHTITAQQLDHQDSTRSLTIADDVEEDNSRLDAYTSDVTPASTKQERTITPSANKPSEAEELAHSFRRACQSYRIEIAECDAARAVVGPTVWRFYVRLKRGQRIDPLRNALEDIGREMRRSGLLLTAIPNSDEIAVDIPRTIRESVPLSRALMHLPEISAPEQMPIPIGVTPEGNDIINDLGLMPHLLVGGTTGSGKTVFLYGLLTALLKTHTDPATLRLLVSTSGPEDFSFFEGLPHIEEGRIIADAGEAIELLQTHVNQIFEERLVQLTNARCRDIRDYNNKHHSSPLPPFVVVIDEFTDLADQLAGNRSRREAFYTNIRRIAQLGRKRGVHLVLCTQRPSADLVPTSIRNLMNGRVALHVNDATASRMVLEETGAEQLQMRGDLLFKDETSLIRAQGYYVTSDELDELLRPYKTLRRNTQTKKKSRK